MYCVHCGKEIPNESQFCGYCGKAAINPNTAPRPQDVEQPRIEPAYPKSGSGPVNDVTQEMAINRNVPYYASEFCKIESGGKAKFNWSAFLFNTSFCLYRRCGDLFQKYYLIPLIILAVSYLVASIGTANFSITSMLIGSIGTTVGSIWYFVNSIRLGRRFNQEYYMHCKRTVDSGNKKTCGTTLAAPILYNAALVVIILLLSFAGAMLGSQGINNSPDDGLGAWSVSGDGLGGFDNLSPGLTSGVQPDYNNPTDSVVRLSSGELSDIQLFLSSIEYNGFIQSAYTDVRDVLLTPIFYNYMDQSVNYDLLLRAYSAKVEEMYGGLSYVSSATFEKVLKDKTGYEPAEMNNVYSFNFDYIPSVDAYCMEVSDSNYTPVNCLSGTREGDIYTIIYENAFGGDWYYETIEGYGFAATMTVTLRDSNNGWQFISNVPNQ